MVIYPFALKCTSNGVYNLKFYLAILNKKMSLSLLVGTTVGTSIKLDGLLSSNLHWNSTPQKQGIKAKLITRPIRIIRSICGSG